MTPVLLVIAVWFGVELLAMGALFAVAALEQRQRDRNAPEARRPTSRGPDRDQGITSPA